MAGESKNPENTVQIQKEIKGRFKPGQSGNPAGKPPGAGLSLLSILKRQLAEGGKADEIVSATIRDALAGDQAARKLVWDRIEGPVRTELTGLDGEALFPAVDLTKLSAAELKAWYELASKAENKLLETD